MFAEYIDWENALYIGTIFILDKFENELDQIDLEREMLDLLSYSSEPVWKYRDKTKKTRVVKEMINYYYIKHYLFIDILNLFLHNTNNDFVFFILIININGLFELLVYT